MNSVIRFFKEWIVPLLIAILLAAAINRFIIFKIRVPTESMVPNIMPRDQIFVTRIHSWNKLSRGDVIVFKSDELKEILVKRLIGLPGDKVEIKSGYVYINGIKQAEPYVKNRDDYTGNFSVPDGKYFFMGDNRPVSLDARFWKSQYIPRSKIMGKAFLIIYPFNRIRILK